MRVQFVRSDQGTGYDVLILREDGLTVQLPGYGRTFRVPHELAHFVAEREFRLERGVFGCIAAGAMFSNMTVTNARHRYDGHSRSRAVLREFAEELSLAECLCGVVHEAIELGLGLGPAHRRLRETWGALRPGPCPFEPADLRRALDRLDLLGARWQAVAPGERLALRWELPPRPVPGRRRIRVPATGW